VVLYKDFPYVLWVVSRIPKLGQGGAEAYRGSRKGFRIEVGLLRSSSLGRGREIHTLGSLAKRKEAVGEWGNRSQGKFCPNREAGKGYPGQNQMALCRGRNFLQAGLANHDISIRSRGTEAWKRGKNKPWVRIY